MESEDKFHQSSKRPESKLQLPVFLPEVLKKKNNVSEEIIELISQTFSEGRHAEMAERKIYQGEK